MKDNKQTVRIGIVAGVAIITAVLCFFQPHWVTGIIHLLFKGDLRGSIHFIRSYGPYAMAVSFFIVVLINATAVLPNIFILAANGIIFGVVRGTLISWLAESIGVIISFLLLRYLLRDYAQRIIAHSTGLKKIDEYSGQKGFRVMLVARSIPYVPSGLITALGALSSISIRDYALATLIGKLPSAWIEVTLGHDLLAYHQHSLRLALLIIVSVLAYSFSLWYKKRGNL
ncbi:Hypothetical protein LUCI_0361 [Lucifera butyrica]|uniref:TVP38/TMEM64 family membrane protein n=1 Tax=Lucifera butyrica TaxID=1351585 RepID=A0A498R136_9FIRM|nr:VTT domain-containing protein [Lucifera butyrica]VBB05154.1 Hypothetical protein LUCI_0361 [Lucifera butyrica]